MQVSTGPLLNTENKESSENRRTERQENEKSVWTGRSKPGVKVHLSLYITRIAENDPNVRNRVDVATAAPATEAASSIVSVDIPTRRQLLCTS